ncbi:high-glucose-regulated protein 8, variant 2 [Coprinopsis cinerea AmutBmut pab1-1]|nr:high-glucose-regulated protein 8, variant 2 [Coprinopsis cinerea AmutBmut pab1-1]
MVEFKAEGMSRATTPVAITQSSKSSLGESFHTLGDAGPSQGDRVSESHFTRPCSLFHEQNSLIPFTSTEHTQPYDEGASTPPDSMPGDASNESTPVRNRSRANNRRRPFVSGGAGRPSAGPPSVSSPSHGYFPPASSSNDNSTPHNSFQPSVIQFPTSPHPFSQGGGYYGQYTVPSHPPSLNIGQPHHAYSYPPHPFQSPQQVSDSNNRVTSPQLTYSQQPLYHYPQQHRSNDGPNPSVSFSNQMSSESVFSPTFPSTNPTNDMAGVNAATPQYMGPPHLSGMGYPSSLRSPQYGYPQQFSPPATVYRPYSAVSYQPHLSPSVEDLHKGSWYFVPHTPQSQQHPYEQYRQGYSYQYQPPAQQRESSSHVSRHPSSASAPPRTHLSEPKFPSASQPGSPPLTASRSSIAGRDSPSSSGQPSTTSKPVVRREWHPRPPAHRSPWAMWVGNVPSDATQEELWRFFTNPPETGNAHATLNAGVESIFLIGRSNCAFINYSSESSVSSAIQTFNGKRLRPNDPQCPMLVCKIRRSADDLKSGVGGQRGIGLHKQWIQSQRMQKCQASGSSDIEASEGNSGSDADHFPNVLGSVSISSGDRRKGTHSSSSDSHASTTSSFLAEYFPTRFFILKSLSEDDLALSVKNGLWATQKHNELLLDQAFRTAKDVFLIFSVNKSGEFYGYARFVFYLCNIFQVRFSFEQNDWAYPKRRRNSDMGISIGRFIPISVWFHYQSTRQSFQSQYGYQTTLRFSPTQDVFLSRRWSRCRRIPTPAR